MSARVLDGKALAAEISRRTKPALRSLRRSLGRPPRLAVVGGGHDPSAEAYAKRIEGLRRAGLDVGVQHVWSRPEAIEALVKLGDDPLVDAVLVETPLPKGLTAAELREQIPASKDAEGLSPENYGKLFLAKTMAELERAQVTLPCTAGAVVRLLAASKISATGRRAVVIGRSEIVGRPVAHLLSCLDATVTLCHSRTEGLAALVRQADIVVACLGKPRFVAGSWIKNGAVVVDAGISFEDGTLSGDVDFAGARKKAGWITPVPGGVGPVTAAVLLENVVKLASRRL